MAPELFATKRKFAELLDRLNGSSVSLHSTDNNNASTTSLATSETSLTKRPKLSDTLGIPKFERARKFNVRTPRNSSESGAPLPSVSTSRPSPSPSGSSYNHGSREISAQSTVQVKQANYSPWSQATFLKRLSTYHESISMWTEKPAQINEVAWAKRGWSRVGWNTVACKGGCEARIQIRLRPKWKNPEGEEVEQSEDRSKPIGESLF
jgi:hypothetical protein